MELFETKSNVMVLCSLIKSIVVSYSLTHRPGFEVFNSLTHTPGFVVSNSLTHTPGFVVSSNSLSPSCSVCPSQQSIDAALRCSGLGALGGGVMGVGGSGDGENGRLLAPDFPKAMQSCMSHPAGLSLGAAGM